MNNEKESEAKQIIEMWQKIKKERSNPSEVINRTLFEPNYAYNLVCPFIEQEIGANNFIETLDTQFQNMLMHGIDDALINSIDRNWNISHAFFFIPKKYGFILPHSSIISVLKSLNAPIVSVGAGTGFLEALVHREDIEIVATDPIPPSPTNKNQYFKGNPFYPIQQMDAIQALKVYSNYAVLCSFPCMNLWAYKMTCEMEKGRTLIYIGEGKGGCNASDEFFEYLDDAFNMTQRIRIPNWAGAHNILLIAIKK